MRLGSLSRATLRPARCGAERPAMHPAAAHAARPRHRSRAPSGLQRPLCRAPNPRDAGVYPQPGTAAAPASSASPISATSTAIRCRTWSPGCSNVTTAARFDLTGMAFGPNDGSDIRTRIARRSTASSMRRRSPITMPHRRCATSTSTSPSTSSATPRTPGPAFSRAAPPRSRSAISAISPPWPQTISTTSSPIRSCCRSTGSRSTAKRSCICPIASWCTTTGRRRRAR